MNRNIKNISEEYYNSITNIGLIEASPHLKHKSINNLFINIINDIYTSIIKGASSPEILDLGAGEGAAALPLLFLGAKVTAVDTSNKLLLRLQQKSEKYSGKLIIRNQDVFEALNLINLEGKKYDLIIANSFLHHIPDYLDLIGQAAAALKPNGTFFSFQDPLRYDSLGRFTLAFDRIAYLSWRVFRRDLYGAFKRTVRRRKGIYLDECPEDNIEYHVTRNGVDQDAIYMLLKEHGFNCNIIRYFSTFSVIWQKIGEIIGVKNAFGVVARKAMDISSS